MITEPSNLTLLNFFEDSSAIGCWDKDPEKKCDDYCPIGRLCSFSHTNGRCCMWQLDVDMSNFWCPQGKSKKSPYSTCENEI
jgi:hypothetical protein